MTSETKLNNTINKICGENNIFFGGYYLTYDKTKMSQFYQDNDKNKTDFHKRLVNIYLCMESIKSLKKKKLSRESGFDMGNLHANLVWYSNMLLLFIGLLDQTSRHLKKSGKTLGMQKRFVHVMNLLDEEEKEHLLSRYLSSQGGFIEIKQIFEHIYNNRNIYAHDMASFTQSNFPQHGELAVITRENISDSMLTISISQASILLYTFKAYLLFIGYEGELRVSRKKPESLVDFL